MCRHHSPHAVQRRPYPLPTAPGARRNPGRRRRLPPAVSERLPDRGRRHSVECRHGLDQEQGPQGAASSLNDRPDLTGDHDLRRHRARRPPGATRRKAAPATFLALHPGLAPALACPAPRGVVTATRASQSGTANRSRANLIDHRSTGPTPERRDPRRNEPTGVHISHSGHIGVTNRVDAAALQGPDQAKHSQPGPRGRQKTVLTTCAMWYRGPLASTTYHSSRSGPGADRLSLAIDVPALCRRSGARSGVYYQQTKNLLVSYSPKKLGFF